MTPGEPIGSLAPRPERTPRIELCAAAVVLPTGAGLDALRAELLPGGARGDGGAMDPPEAAGLAEMGVRRIPFDLKALVPRRGLAALSRSALLTAASVEQLLGASGRDPAGGPASTAIVVGSAHGHIESRAQFFQEARVAGPRLVSPIVFPNTLLNSMAGHAAILFGLSGPNSTVTSGRRSGLEALLRARMLLAAGRARSAVVVGVDALCEALVRGLARGARQEERPRAPVAEGAAALLLEAIEGEPDRVGGEALSLDIAGWGEATTVGLSLMAALREAMTTALSRARRRPEEVAWGILSGGCAALAVPEEEAYRALCGGKPMLALDRALGETLGAGGVLAAACGSVLAASGELRRRLLGSPLAPCTPLLISAVDHDGAMAVVLDG